MQAGRAFLALAAGLAIVAVVAANLVARVLGEDVNILLSTLTALVVGTFVALLLLGARRRRPSARGFDVEAVRKKDDE